MAIFSFQNGNNFSDVVTRLLDDLRKQMPVSVDPEPGSVVRTLVEAFAREMALFYAMLERAYASGFLDSAEGEALDNVVAVLGIERARAGRLVGHVEFRRGSAAPDDIGIPAGRTVTGPRPEGKEPLPIFETMENAVLPRGETSVLVAVQEVVVAGKKNDERFSVINPGMITLMPRPVLGIDYVNNPAPLRRYGEDETDESLRARARTALRDGEKGTLGAIAAAIKEQGVEKVTVRERSDGPPGIVEVLIGDAGFETSGVKINRVRQAIAASKAAGIRVNLQFAKTLYLEPTITIEPTQTDLDADGFARLSDELTAALKVFVGDLPVGTTVSWRKLEAILYGHPGVHRVGKLVLALFELDSESDTFVPMISRVIAPGSDLRLESLERLIIDDRKPPVIIQIRPTVYAMHLVVSLNASDIRSRDEVRNAVRATIEAYGARVTQQVVQAIEWAELETSLVTYARIRELQAATIINEIGLSTDLQEAPNETFTIPVADYRIELGGVEFTEVKSA